MITELDVDAIRASLPVTERLAYLNTGTAGPLPQPAVDAEAEAAKREATEGRIGHDGFMRLFDRLIELRAGLAAFVGAKPEEIAISHNTTDGMNIGTWSLPWQPGDRVVTTTLEHPGALLPLYLLHRRFGVEVDFAEIGLGERGETLAAMAQAIRPGTKLVVVSHVAWGTGAILPLSEISELAHAAGALVLVDGAQSVGSIAVDMYPREPTSTPSPARSGSAARKGRAASSSAPTSWTASRPPSSAGSGSSTTRPTAPTTPRHSSSRRERSASRSAASTGPASTPCRRRSSGGGPSARAPSPPSETSPGTAWSGLASCPGSRC